MLSTICLLKSQEVFFLGGHRHKGGPTTFDLLRLDMLSSSLLSISIYTHRSVLASPLAREASLCSGQQAMQVHDCLSGENKVTVVY